MDSQCHMHYDWHWSAIFKLNCTAPESTVAKGYSLIDLQFITNHFHLYVILLLTALYVLSTLEKA